MPEFLVRLILVLVFFTILMVGFIGAWLHKKGRIDLGMSLPEWVILIHVFLIMDILMAILLTQG